ncbi:MAG TPA: hypothetical protein VK666_12585 [Chryseolinea sp.]|nr:hypothetical protein [Chryseolinea sp.]
MEPKFFSTMSNQVYISLWNKYRPVIIQLMVASADGPQKYKFFDHEFKALNPKEKGYSFALHAFQGKATNNIKTSVMAQDLLNMLNMSRKASELMSLNHFEFSMDKQFMLHVNRKAPVEAVAAQQ